jgi:uncharacterized protein (UPF0332 family)
LSIDKLLESGKIHRFNATKDEIKKSLEIATRDIELADDILSKNLDWCLTITYNGVLQVCRAYMFSLGYRASSHASHKIVFEFMESVVGEKFKDTVTYFDRIRKKRHRTVYDEIGLVSKKEASEALQTAEEFIDDVKKWINEKHG